MNIVLFFSQLPGWYQASIIFLLGLIVGSFLNVVIYRYHTGKSLNGHSHCLSCGMTLQWFELFPVLSYVMLRGKCRHCGCRIPFRYALVEISTAVLFLGAFLQFSITPLLLFSLFLFSLLIIIAVYDWYHMIIPNQLVWYLSALALVYYLLQYGFVYDTTILLNHTLAALGAFLFYGGLWCVSKGRWIGFGDAKLALPLGFILGIPSVFSFVVLSFWVGAIISVGIMGFPVLWHKLQQRYTTQVVVKYSKSFTIKTEVPFAPFMVIAFLLVYLYNISVIALTSLFI